ncbi:thioesterase family protein [Amycolatopsis saalfeldensis]|uniref:Acyl-CoA thioester hydrolase n=1 Tax=Amycolatopsis saalfeldensis TaxID=394193 RepID=A0A1H8UK93_9PSEU|nr:thioesterase family protein [Amycolatopsis saalfeldensis]SEP03506.1 acyl-CoA thioester hydrolase [Amycolatopsis saalfeldensis]
MDPLTLAVRADDLDPNGHVRGPAYLAYADHARWAGLVAAGVDLAALREHGVGPVNLTTTIRHLGELRALDSVTITSAYEWGDGKTSSIRQQLHRADGLLVAEVTSVCGLLDLTGRRLVPRPQEHWRAHAAEPGLLGL